jgi:GAF domain-containing protein
MKARRQKRTRVKRREAPAAGRRRDPSPNLEKQLDQRTSELAEVRKHLAEALEQQTATAEVLAIIGRSPTDVQPVFDAIAESAGQLCEAELSAVYRYEGKLIRVAANTLRSKAQQAAFHQLYPMPPGRGTPVARAILERKTQHVPDTRDDPDFLPALKNTGFRSALATPMLREGAAIGAIAVGRMEVRAFTEGQIKLLETFANQAVIAIENARLLNELHARTSELMRSVEELRAFGQVSQAVNSTLDLKAVLDTIVAKAAQISGTEAGAIYVFDDQRREFQLSGTFGMGEEMISAVREMHAEISEAVGLVTESHEPNQAADLRELPSTALNDVILRAGFRARLLVPLLRSGKVVGALVVRRRNPGEFPASTVDLLQTFAAQSVLAIQNARLFHEIEEKGRQLAEASQHKSQFLANMSHELRTPLNAIIGVTEMLREDAEAAKQDLEPLDRVLGAGRHLLALINDILDLSKIEAGRMELHLETFPLAPLIEDVAKTIEPWPLRTATAS